MITRTLSAVLAFAVLAGGCAPAAATSATAAAISAPATSAAPVPTAGQPEAATATAAPTAPPPAPAAPADLPPEVAAAPADLPPEVAAQAPALIPAAAGDLSAAGAWDRYTIIAALSPGDLSVRGTVTLDMVNRYGVDLDQIAFHLYPNHPDFGGRLDVTSATVDGAPVPSGAQHSDTLLRLDLPKSLAPGDSARVVLGFTATTPRAASAKTFGAYNFEAGVWSMANFYPILARHSADTGWDTRPIESRGDFVVSSVALYDVTIDAPSGWTLVSSGVTVSDGPVNEQVHRQRFVSGPQREFYLGALQGLAQAEAVVDGTRVVSYYQKGSAEAGQAGLEVAERSLRAFNERYGVYPLAELEVIQSALTQFLGMEYPGVVLIEQKLYGQSGRGLETTIAHEIAHQWWYSQVGNDAQGEAWLDEGLASYSQVVYYEAIGEPEKAAAELQFFRDTFRSARAAGRDAPLSSSPAQLGGGRYYPVIYAKGPLFFQALRNQLGGQGFDSFIHAYYRDFRYQDIGGADLLRVAQESCGCDLSQLYDDWVLTAAPVAIP
ncbi:M1 family metallopeptidase [Oscillochloris sp. ZM17-4]|uniref:M1 family metallopeptidase n=1 Tax=Oscillochloris sp. ZM17-4 TaxID=2866714 RepID=UPI001C730F64|nr:M1 family metallopeptidase [Oscillochloris sp. ZM17-4]MBX0327788.1 M1 family metallopeptidase [Oscillochloris sp. ZM17-4]